MAGEKRTPAGLTEFLRWREGKPKASPKNGRTSDDGKASTVAARSIPATDQGIKYNCIDSSLTGTNAAL